MRTEDFFWRKKSCHWNLLKISRIRFRQNLWFSINDWFQRCMYLLSSENVESYALLILNVEWFESAVPAIFLSYAPTFFAILLWQLYRLHMSEEFFNSSMTVVSSSYEWSKYSSIFHWQLYRLHMSEKLLNSSLKIVSSSINVKQRTREIKWIHYIVLYMYLTHVL